MWTLLNSEFCPVSTPLIANLAIAEIYAMTLFRFYKIIFQPTEFCSLVLTHISLASFLWDVRNLCRPRSDAAERGVWSGSALLENLPQFKWTNAWDFGTYRIWARASFQRPMLSYQIGLDIYVLVWIFIYTHTWMIQAAFTLGSSAEPWLLADVISTKISYMLVEALIDS